MARRRWTPEQIAEERGYEKGYRYAKEDWQKEMDELKAAAKAVVAAWRDLTSRGMDDDVGERIEDLERLVGEEPDTHVTHVLTGTPEEVAQQMRDLGERP